MRWRRHHCEYVKIKSKELLEHYYIHSLGCLRLKIQRGHFWIHFNNVCKTEKLLNEIKWNDKLQMNSNQLSLQNHHQCHNVMESDRRAPRLISCNVNVQQLRELVNILCWSNKCQIGCLSHVIVLMLQHYWWVVRRLFVHQLTRHMIRPFGEHLILTQNVMWNDE